MITVKELRKILKTMPDEALVAIEMPETLNGMIVNEIGDIYWIYDTDLKFAHITGIEAFFVEEKEDAIAGFPPSPVFVLTADNQTFNQSKNSSVTP